VRISKYLSCSAAFKNLSTAFQLDAFSPYIGPSVRLFPHYFYIF
jgi:hypothetical protein